MPISKVLTEGKVPVKIFTDEVEETAMQQLIACSNLPFIHKHIAAMPDVHAGYGATIGSVIPTKGVECRKDAGVVDEIPAAYKDIDVVMSHQSDLVEVLHTLKQVVCIKG